MDLLVVAMQINPDGFRVDPAWVFSAFTSILTAVTGALVYVYRGQVKALTDENNRLWGLLTEQANTAKYQGKNLDRAVTLAEIRAEILRNEVK